MNDLMISKISELILDDSFGNLNEIEFAIQKLNEVLETEKIRKKQILDEINENIIPSDIVFLDDHLILIKKNILNLTNYLDLLFIKKRSLEFNKLEKLNLNPNLICDFI